MSSPCRRRAGGGGVRRRLRGETPGRVSVYGGARCGKEAAVAAADAACMADMEASAAARGERVVMATRGESAAVRCDAVRAKSTVVAETRRSRRTCMVAQRSRRLAGTIMEEQWRSTAGNETAGCCSGSERWLVPEACGDVVAQG